MNKYEVGQTVWTGRGNYQRQLVIARIIDNPMIPIYQYTFEAPYDGFACDEQSIRENEHDADSTLRDCFKKESADNEVATRFNTIASALRHPIEIEGTGLEELYKNEMVKFKPDLKFCKWLKEYANGRLIIDIGSGQGLLVNMLDMVDTGTGLGWCEYNGDCEMSGAFTSYENALEDALNLIDKCDLLKFRKEVSISKFHWGNYADHLNAKYRVKRVKR